MVRWLGQQAEELGVELYPGIAASQILYHENGSVKGIKTNDLGVSKSGKKKDTFQEGMELHADCTLFAEGCRGSLTRLLFEKYDLRKGVSHQTYGIGIKEVWKLDSSKHKLGTVMHTIGYPLDTQTYGGGFIYHWEENQVYFYFLFFFLFFLHCDPNRTINELAIYWIRVRTRLQKSILQSIQRIPKMEAPPTYRSTF